MIPSKIKLILVTVMLLLLGAETVQAQFGRLRDRAVEAAANRAEQRIEREINQRVEAAAERAVDNAFDSVFGSPLKREDYGSDEEYQRARSSWRTSMFGSMMNVETRDEYPFSIRNHMRFTSVDENGRASDEGEVVFLIEPGALYSGTLVQSENGDAESVIMVFDIEYGAMVMFMTTEGERLSMAYGSGNWMAEIDMDDDEGIDQDFVFGEHVPEGTEVESLGTRTIHGIRASGYRVSDESAEMEIWVADDENFSGRNMGAGNPGFQRANPAAAAMMPASGLPLEMTSHDKSTGAIFKMESIDIDRNARINLNRRDYPPLSFGE